MQDMNTELYQEVYDGREESNEKLIINRSDCFSLKKKKANLNVTINKWIHTLKASKGDKSKSSGEDLDVSDFYLPSPSWFSFPLSDEPEVKSLHWIFDATFLSMVRIKVSPLKGSLEKSPEYRHLANIC